MIDNLVYDVGMHNGDDTAYYLARGYRVVAIEADPTLADDGRKRFADALAAKRLTIVNCAVGPENTKATFWICPSHRHWNSFIKESAGRNGLEHYPLEVSIRRFADVMAEYGVPLYLKIDIEGHDHHCLAGINPADPPRYVSWELSDAGEIYKMRERGYNAFKCISQSTFTPFKPGRTRGSQSLPLRNVLRKRALQTLMAVPGAMAAAKAVKRTLNGEPSAAGATPGDSPAGEARTLIRSIQWPGGVWDFYFASSGPFGPDLGGEWKSADEVVYEYLDYWVNLKKRSTGDQGAWGDWFDIHATTLPPDQAPTLEPRAQAR
ncbi:MAG: FkbM family methyltransferase [Phycisphaerales bacterium]